MLIAAAFLPLCALSCDSGSTAPRADSPAIILRVPSDSIFYGRSVQVYAVATDDTSATELRPYVWTSSDTNVAVVDSLGRVTAIGLGTATIVATRPNATSSTVLRSVLAWSSDGVAYAEGSASQNVADRLCAITTAGAVRCRPASAPDTVVTFDPLPGGAGIEFVSVFSAFGNECGLTSASEIRCWGSNGDWILGTRVPTRSDTAPLRVKTDLTFSAMVAASHTHICAIARTDSIVRCWGHPHAGVLGRPITPHTYGVGADSLLLPVTGGFKARAVSASNHGSCALDLVGTPYCWGLFAPILGAPESAAAPLDPVPGPVAGGVGLGLVDLAVGENRACGLTLDGRGYCWGRGRTGASEPAAPVPGALRFSRIYAVGAGAGCGLTVDHDLYCWGTVPPIEVSRRYTDTFPTPFPVAPGTKFRALITAGSRLCGVALDGRIACW